MHNYGLAVDVVPYLSGSSGPLNWNPHTDQFQAMVAALKGQGLVWGGDWQHLADYDHFQMPTVPTSPTPVMLADYGDGTDLGQIWENAGNGKYAG
jgi:hypothetical protein